MTKICKALSDGVRVSTFDLHVAIFGEAARRVDGRLRVHSEIQNVRHKARMSGRLVSASHNTKRHDDLAVLPQHRGYDRVHGPLSALQFVWMAFFEREACTAVVQQDAILVGCDARPEVLEDRINQ